MNYRNRMLILFAALVELPLAVAQDLQPSVAADVSGVATAQSAGTVPRWPTRDTNSNLDVRFCLDFATNLEVITCAEKYRPHRR
jgi:hypothetical protein